jgi:hypothetical protein
MKPNFRNQSIINPVRREKKSEKSGANASKTPVFFAFSACQGSQKRFFTDLLLRANHSAPPKNTKKKSQCQRGSRHPN